MSKYIICCMFFLLTACQNHTVYHVFQPVPETGWRKSDTLTYTLPTNASSASYTYKIGIRHKDCYPYRDIWMTIKYANHVDTLHLYLADKTGNWKGNGIGNTRQYTAPISLNPAFQLTDSINPIQLSHIMQDEPLMGISDIGIQVSSDR